MRRLWMGGITSKIIRTRIWGSHWIYWGSSRDRYSKARDRSKRIQSAYMENHLTTEMGEQQLDWTLIQRNSYLQLFTRKVFENMETPSLHSNIRMSTPRIRDTLKTLFLLTESMEKPMTKVQKRQQDQAWSHRARKRREEERILMTTTTPT